MYIQTSHTRGYEVKEGALSINNTYRGIAIREEHVITTDTAGYINYYTQEGERVAKGDLVYTVDETGKLNEYLACIDSSERNLTDNEVRNYRSTILNFIHNFHTDCYE